MSRRTVALLAAGGATLFALVALAHGPLIVIAIAGAAVATGLATYYNAPARAYW